MMTNSISEQHTKGSVSDKSHIKDCIEIANYEIMIYYLIISTKMFNDLWCQLKFDELELRYKKVMMGNAQLDNEKHANQYQLELLKDKVGDLEEDQIELKRQLQHVSQVAAKNFSSACMWCSIIK